MKARSPAGRRRPVVATAVLATQLAACSSWHVEQVAPEQLLHQRAPAEVRVTRTDGNQLVLAQPQLSGDSLTGFHGGVPGGVPLGDIGTIATRHGDAGKSVLLGLGIVGGLFATAAVALSGQKLGSGGF
jgi:hypothetical protein